MNDYLHLIITRFNIRIDDQMEYAISDAWMDYRLRLFEQYCIPSVKAQTCRNFRWVILLDADTPDMFRQRLASYSSLVEQMDLLYLKPFTDFMSFYQSIAEQYRSKCRYLITSRLDNDDMLAGDYVERVQAAALRVGSYPMVLTFPHGVQLFTHDKVNLSMRWRDNHFVSLVESADEMCYTALGFSHLQIGAQLAITDLDTDLPEWGELVHGGNVINNFTPHVRTGVVKYTMLPFPGEWNAYLRVWRNRYYRLVYYLRYRKRSIINLFLRISHIGKPC